MACQTAHHADCSRSPVAKHFALRRHMTNKRAWWLSVCSSFRASWLHSSRKAHGLLKCDASSTTQLPAHSHLRGAHTEHRQPSIAAPANCSNLHPATMRNMRNVKVLLRIGIYATFVEGALCVIPRFRKHISTSKLWQHVPWEQLMSIVSLALQC